MKMKKNRIAIIYSLHLKKENLFSRMIYNSLRVVDELNLNFLLLRIIFMVLSFDRRISTIMEY